MRRNRITTAIAVSAVAALSLAACGGNNNGNGNNSGGGSGSTKAAFDAANGKLFNPSDQKGGTLRMAITEKWDSTDPGDTYYGLSWNLIRNYARALVVFKSAPGAEGGKLVPDLAESLGVPSD